ncbi:MAG: DNA-processing protein DprA [Woeseiaceae bacterium]|nr:DNA-processing protein DprA [Woeseiaceae bacterium]
MHEEPPVTTVAHGEPGYPQLLAEASGAPLLLYVKGSVDALHLPAIAIVGSRNPTDGGERNAYEFAKYLAGCGFCIVSGLATGIDAAAHRGALDAPGTTVAVLGHGIDHVYPKRNRKLAASIAARGALVTEYPAGMPPMAALFPQRNRLISGLSLGTLVVEAARRSGSLITARFAADQGREVFALPGSIHNPLSRGCHRLIGDGAKLVETADDILAELAPHARATLQNSTESSTRATSDDASAADDDPLLRCLSHDPIGIDELVERAGLTIREVCSMLLILELDGKVEKLAGGRYVLRS